MTHKRRQVGLAGEEAARFYLEKQGYKVIERNYRCPLGELDLIALDERTTVIIEIRAKTGLSYGSPEESITADKGRRLLRLAQYYLKSKSKTDAPSRIDLVAVMLNNNDLTVKSINHIKGILIQ